MNTMKPKSETIQLVEELERKAMEVRGYEFARGACKYIAQCLLQVIIFVGLFVMLANWLNWLTDDSDKNGWNRSGLSVRTDYKTGKQYLVTPKGGIIQR